MERKVATTVEPLQNDFEFGPWTIKTMKGTIMKSADSERYHIFNIIYANLTLGLSFTDLVQNQCWKTMIDLDLFTSGFCKDPSWAVAYQWTEHQNFAHKILLLEWD